MLRDSISVGINKSGRLATAAALGVCLLISLPISTAGQQQADPLVTDVPLEMKIGQLLMVGFRGTTLTEDHFILRDLRQHHLGGVILFDYDLALKQADRNIRSPEQLKRLIASLQDAATIPLLVAVDQEGGRVARLKPVHGFAPTPSHAQLGRKNDLRATYAAGATIAADLAATGINLNFAPVVDLCVNPDNPVIARLERCFSHQPNSVTRHAQQFIQAHQDQGVITVIKHFPGHGSSQQDSHLGFVDVTSSWTAAELGPYIDLIAAGKAEAIMTAHVFNAILDADHPATLSSPTITELLRKELGFDGVVISDDLQMGAITERYGLEQAVQLALEAGVDILLFGNNLDYDPEIVPRATEAIRQLVMTGVIPAARIDQSYRRVMQLKEHAE